MLEWERSELRRPELERRGVKGEKWMVAFTVHEKPGILIISPTSRTLVWMIELVVMPETIGVEQQQTGNSYVACGLTHPTREYRDKKKANINREDA